ncbi:MAG TPA: hypothetical protein PK079_20400 [Leptospiraceae bacterium]|nr:hypothetical protein [Leptospiraceae bacterium]HMY32219.1 hypothetical protein [Leptospiraceae bacterium]HMZ67432.1 hypothetical protein [Leptospiraceae bacterium]HNA10442.1 hypothetical protein [Leptospiraceae bacterium]HNC56253.1 hypothetical protein [Leptospiraceae bacterium]
MNSEKLIMNNAHIHILAKELVRVKKQAAALGMFTNDRELLECNRCGLVEDVTIQNILITYFKNEKEDALTSLDSGLRFTETNDPNIFVCPSCGNNVELPVEDLIV